MKRIFFLLTLACTIFAASAQLIKEGERAPWKKPVVAQFLQGAVPVVDGKVLFTRTIEISDAKAANLDQTFEMAKHWVSNQFGSNPDMLSRKSIDVNASAHTFTLQVEQWLVFTNMAWSLDRSRIYYTMNVTMQGNKATLTFSDITYLYEEERAPTKLTAEEQIIDEVCLKKNGKTFFPTYGKFRVRTIQMVDSIAQSLQDAMK